MPNGTDLPDDILEEFKRLEEPLCHCDETLSAFACKIDAEVDRNYHNYPGRDITWIRGDGITVSIQLTPVIDKPGRSGKRLASPLYFIGIAAWRDTSAGRSSWHRAIWKSETLPLVSETLTEILNNAHKELMALAEEDLKRPTGDLGRPLGPPPTVD